MKAEIYQWRIQDFERGAKSELSKLRTQYTIDCTNLVHQQKIHLVRLYENRNINSFLGQIEFPK